MNRLDSGFRLYHRGKCSLIFEDDDENPDSGSEWIYRLSSFDC